MSEAEQGFPPQSRQGQSRNTRHTVEISTNGLNFSDERGDVSTNVPEPEDHQRERAKQKWKITLVLIAGIVMLVVSFLAGKAIREQVNSDTAPAVTWGVAIDET